MSNLNCKRKDKSLRHLTIYTMRIAAILFLVVLVYSCNESARNNSKSNTSSAVESGSVNMNDTLRDDILKQIDIDVRSGFYTKEEIFTNVEDYLYEIPFDKVWVKEQIEMTYSKQLVEQAKQPSITDFDKLVQAFDELNSSGIIALHRAGVTKQDGEGDCEEIHEDLAKKGIKTKGFCYYHWQDVERVIDGDNLYIGFGDFDSNDKAAAEIGTQVAETLRSKGFEINWDKTAYTRIEITNIKWQKSFGNASSDYDRAIRLLSSQKN